MAAQRYYVWDYPSVVEVGSGCRTFAPERFIEMGARRVGLITDAGLVKAGVAEMVVDVFKAQREPGLAGIYDKVEPDAKMSGVNDCARWVRENAIDGLLAVGGGSVLDTVKGVKAMLGLKAVRIQDLMPGNIGLYSRPVGKRLNFPHVAIPTTAGTGAEVSPVAVVYNAEQQVKGDLLHPFLGADFAFLDPDLTLGLPAKITADTGFDALSHAVEGLSSPNTNAMIDAIDEAAIRLVVENLPRAVANGKDLEARTNMLAASNMAIMGFSMAGSFYPIHNVAHPCGGLLRIPHGSAIAVLIPVLMEHYPQHYLPSAMKMARAFGVYRPGASDQELVTLTTEAVRALQKQCGVRPKFDIKLDATQFDKMFEAIRSDPAGLFYPLPGRAIKGVLAAVFETM
jgi:alcohol dehydrogenase class IV